MSGPGVINEASIAPSGGEPTENDAFASLLRRVANAPARDLPANLAPGTIVDDKLEVLRLIGRGGMGAVYLARHQQLSRLVALKVTSGGASEAATARMLREAQAMAAIIHDNVVTVYDVGTTDGQIFIAMEYVEGGTIRTWCQQQRRSWREILGIFVQAGRGLAAAHTRGLVHRDFKPDNVLIGDDGRVRVADFGLARLMASEAAQDDDELGASHDQALEGPTDSEGGARLSSKMPIYMTATGATVGTPAYMALEQFEGRPPDERSDQFSFCVSLFEALYGQRPFAGAAIEELVASLCDGEVVVPADDRKVPARVRRALLRGLSADADQRFSSMDDLLWELSRALTRTGRMAAVVVASLAVGGAAAWAATDAAVMSCEDSATLRDLWNDETRATMRGELNEADVQSREKVWSDAEGKLDRFVSEWESIYREACAAAPDKRQIALSCLQARRKTLLDALTPVEGSGTTRAAAIGASGIESAHSCRPAPAPEVVEAAAVDAAEQAEAQWQSAVRLYRVGNFDEALVELEKIDVSAPGVAGTHTHGLALAMIGDIVGAAGRREDAERHWRRAVPILIAADDVNTAIQTTATLAWSLLDTGYASEEVRLLIDLADAWLQRATGREWLSGKVAIVRARVLADDGELDEAAAMLRAALAQTDEAGAPGPFFDLQFQLAKVVEAQGDLEQAEALFAALHRAQQSALPAEHTRVLMPQVYLAALKLQRGALDECGELLDALPADYRVHEEPTAMLRLRTRAGLLARRGDPSAARRHFEEGLAAAAGIFEAGQAPPDARAELALWQAKDNDIAAARALIAEALAQAKDSDDRSTPVVTRAYAAAVALQLGDLEVARRHLEEADADLRALPPHHLAVQRAKLVRDALPPTRP